MRVTITKANVFSPFGVPFAINSIQTVTDDYGRSLILSQQATDTDGVLSLPGPAPFDALGVRWADGVPTALIKPDGTLMPIMVSESGIPMYLPPSGFMANNGVMVIGQAPSGAATATFSAVSGAGVTMTMSAATLLGTAADVGRVLTILDGGVYKYATITAQNSTTVATVTLTGVLSGVGPFANNTIWLSGSPPATANTSGFSVPFDNAFPNCYLYLPAGALFAGSLAGQYLGQMPSTTLIQFYNNLYVSGTPTIPATLQPFVCTGPGAFVQTTGAMITMASVVIPGNSIGLNGKVKATCIYQNNNSAGSKTWSIKFGGSQTFGSAATANQTMSVIREIYNRGATNVQMSAANGMSGTGLAAGNTQVYAKDTTQAQNVDIQNQLAVATDWTGIDSFSVELR